MKGTPLSLVISSLIQEKNGQLRRQVEAEYDGRRDESRYIITQKNKLFPNVRYQGGHPARGKKECHRRGRSGICYNALCCGEGDWVQMMQYGLRVSLCG
jgi:hypothetical protein